MANNRAGCFQAIASSFNWTRLVHRVKPSLIKIDKEDDIVSEATDSCHGRHSDDEREQIINECIQTLVDQHSPRKVRNRFELVIQESYVVIERKRTENQKTRSTHGNTYNWGVIRANPNA